VIDPILSTLFRGSEIFFIRLFKELPGYQIPFVFDVIGPKLKNQKTLLSYQEEFSILFPT